MNLTYCDWKWFWRAHPALYMSVLQDYCGTVQVFPMESGTWVGKGKKPLACPCCDWSVLILTGLSFGYFCQCPGNCCVLYVITKGFLKVAYSSTPLLTFVWYTWMFWLCHCAKFHQFSLLVNQLEVIYIILRSELGRIRIILRRVHCVDWRPKQ